MDKRSAVRGSRISNCESEETEQWNRGSRIADRESAGTEQGESRIADCKSAGMEQIRDSRSAIRDSRFCMIGVQALAFHY